MVQSVEKEILNTVEITEIKIIEKISKFLTWKSFREKLWDNNKPLTYKYSTISKIGIIKSLKFYTKNLRNTIKIIQNYFNIQI